MPYLRNFLSFILASKENRMEWLMEKFLLVLIVISVLSFFVFLGINYHGTHLASLSTTVTAWVTINPLDVDIFAPKQVKVDRIFIIRAEIENKGKEEVREVEAQIFLPEEIDLIRGEEEQEIGALGLESKKFIFWWLKGKKAGSYIISVKVTGELRGEVISAEDSTMIKIKEKKTPSWWQRFYDIINLWRH